eukprot:c6372_g1_i1 orf=478-1692(+)
MPTPVLETAFVMKERTVQKPKGRASVLAIGTANPPNAVEQRTYPDFYFNVTNNGHKTELKKKFQRICDNSGIKKRYMLLTEEILRSNPTMCAYWEDSLDARQDIAVSHVPKLAEEAALKAIKEWGQPKSSITHLVFCTNSGVDMPGADCVLVRLIGLPLTVKRVMLYQQGCFAGGTALRIARDLAENHNGARVLAVCSEIIAMHFRGPSEEHIDSLVGQSLFSDGASAIIVGADPIPGVEKAWFELAYAESSLVPDSDTAIEGHLRQGGLTFKLVKQVPELISKNIASVVKNAFESVCELHEPLDFNKLFWVVHPGGRAILDEIQTRLNLEPEKLQPSRTILSEYGNMSSACVLFILDYFRRSSIEIGSSTSGQGCAWGVLMGFGPGLTVETVILKALPTCEAS